ncbi:MAG: pyrroline-5-carboxylate reductase [Hyphomicrobiaceae bacterium]|nr:MAG: pyrroline-5-carboxylate reductase [Hyphomicrobiaceae bacterium]
MAFEIPGNILVAGAGNMGGALITGFLQRGIAPRSILVQDPSPPPAISDLLAQHSVEHHASISTLPEAPAVILVAVKPQIMEEAFPPLAKLAGPSTVVLSVAAGRTIASFERHLSPGAAVIRSIPNTPAAIGRGITVAVANRHVTSKQRQIAESLLSAVGEVAFVEDEALIDPVTAVSGSGPAYVFLLAECLAEAGVKAGLAPDLAARLARATVAGAGELMRRSPLPPDQLRRNVTSPNGTTAAALGILMGTPGLSDLMTRAVAAATRRGQELAR